MTQSVLTDKSNGDISLNEWGAPSKDSSLCQVDIKVFIGGQYSVAGPDGVWDSQPWVSEGTMGKLTRAMLESPPWW